MSGLRLRHILISSGKNAARGAHFKVQPAENTSIYYSIDSTLKSRENTFYRVLRSSICSPRSSAQNTLRMHGAPRMRDARSRLHYKNCKNACCQSSRDVQIPSDASESLKFLPTHARGHSYECSHYVVIITQFHHHLRIDRSSPWRSRSSRRTPRCTLAHRRSLAYDTATFQRGLRNTTS